jgi:hypothetical protein
MSDAVLVAAGVAGAFALIAAARTRVGFAAQKPADYAGQAPQFDIRRELNGPILCEGVIYGPTGRVTSRFVADMNARWEGNRCTMTEAFRYESGRRQDRVWTLTLGNDGAIRAEAPDVPGGGSGRQEGSAVMLTYPIQLPKDAGGHVLNVTDWMYLTPNGTIINRSQFRKFGLKVAELVATMRRVPA